MRRLRSVLGAAAVLLAAGCGRGPYQVSGTISFDGKPMPDGYVRFVSVDRPLEVAVGPIKDGAFSLKATAGAKRVEVLATKVVNPEHLDPMGNPMHEEYVPPDYRGEKSPLRAEVEANDSNHFTFDVPPDPDAEQ